MRSVDVYHEGRFLATAAAQEDLTDEQKRAALARRVPTLAGGWYHTGDLGYMDDRGFLYLVDRAKDMIVTGGENVYSFEVEEALYRHECVLEAAVFAIPDDRWGEAVHAVVAPRAAVAEAELLVHCRALIAAYKFPTDRASRRAAAEVGRGQDLKRELRAPYWAGRETMIAGA